MNTKKLSLSFLLGFVLAFSGSVFAADITWDGLGVDHSWHTPENWVTDQVPHDPNGIGVDSAWIDTTLDPVTTNNPVCSQAATISYLVVGGGAGSADYPLEVVSGGDIRTNNNHVFIANGAAATGKVVMTGGQIIATGAGQIVVGQNGTGILEVGGDAYIEGDVVQVGQLTGSTGTLTISDNGYVNSRYWVAIGHNGAGTLQMNGGTLYVADGQRLIVAVAWATPQFGHIQLDGGIINVDQMDMGDIGTLDIRNDGIIIFRNGMSLVPSLETLIGEGRFTAYGGRGEIIVEDVGAETHIYTQPLDLAKAWSPTPGNKALFSVLEAETPVLFWKKGDNAVSHDVYFGDDFDAVAAADNTDLSGIYRGNQLEDPNNRYVVPDTLQLGETYYWRIDEVNGDSSITTGSVWSVSIESFFGIEDFEDYGSSSALRGIWSSSVIYLNTAIDDDKVMEVRYNTSASPFKTETSRSFSGSDSNWTAKGVQALRLNFRGDQNTEPVSMYVTLSDGTNSASVNYDGEMSDLLQFAWQSGWTNWDIDLDDFANVNPANIMQMTIGFGDGAGAGGSGKVYFDDIRLYVPRCLSSKLPGDIALGDCFSDMYDFAVLAADWMETGYQVTSTPTSAVPVLYYTFDETTGTNAADSSGNNYDGTVSDGQSTHWNASGYINGCFYFNGFVALDVPPDSLHTISDQVTISFWSNGDASQPAACRLLHAADMNSGSADQVIMVSQPWSDGDIIWGTTSEGSNWTRWTAEHADDIKGVWTHYAFVKDANTGFMGIYRNGELVQSIENATVLMSSSTTDFHLGSNFLGTADYHIGRLDEFKIFDVALSHAEIMDLAGVSGTITVPLNSSADVDEDGVVDLDDLQEVLAVWLTEVVWP